MQLFYSPPSPFVRKVLVTLHETDQIDDVELVSVTAVATNTGTTPVPGNPLGKIPALARPGGPTLFDSRVIMRFLNDRAEAALYPEARLYEVLTLEALAHGLSEAAVLMVYEKRLRPEAQQSPDWVAGQWTKVSRALDAIEGQWMSHLHGPLDAAQIAVGCALGYLDFRHGDRDWRVGRPGLTAWAEGFHGRPSMTATQPE